jgi:UDP-galactopyranose mutase
VTTIVREFPQEYGPGREPYYPIPAPDARAQYERYAELAEQEKGVSFVGRLATYRYYNMDQVVGMALAEFEKIFFDKLDFVFVLDTLENWQVVKD